MARSSRIAEPLPPEETPLTRRAALTGVRRIVALARPEWRALAVGTACLFVASAATLYFPQALRSLFDGALSGPESVASVDRSAVLLLALGLVSAIASGIRFALFTTAGERVVAKLRKDVYAHLLDQEIAFFDEQRTGDLTSRLAADASVLQGAVSTNLSMFLRNGASVVGGIAMLFVTSFRLTLVMLAVVPAVALGAVAYGRRIRRVSRDVQDAVGDAASVGEEALAGIRTVRAFATEHAEGQRYGEAIDRSFVLAKKRNAMSATFMGVTMAAAMGSIALVLGYGGRLATRGEISVGALASFLVYTIVVAGSLGALSDLSADFLRAAGAAERIFDVLDRAPTIPTQGGMQPAHVIGRVELDDVAFEYPTRRGVRALDGVSFTIEPGTVVALVGPSGSGKSTVAALLTRLYDPTMGAIRLDGAAIDTLDPKWLRRQIGVVAQEPLLFSTTILENLRYGRETASLEEVETASRAANAHDFIMRLPEGYATRVGERGAKLSGGQRQRLAIARALLKDPKLVILDEATSALDAESEHVVQEALDRLLEGRTVLVIAHRLSTVKNADRVLVLDGGRVAQEGTHHRLVAEVGLYRRLVERQLHTEVAVPSPATLLVDATL